MSDPSSFDSFSPSNPWMLAALGGGLGLGMMAALFGSRPRTAYMHAEAVRHAEAMLEAASLRADQAYILVSKLQAEEHSAVKQLLAANAHRVALERAKVCRQDLEEAKGARDVWMASLQVMREVVSDLRAAETAAEAVQTRSMERTLLAGFTPFFKVEKALRALQSVEVSLDVPAQEKADDALGEALGAALVWLSNPANVDPTVAPPRREGAAEESAEPVSGVEEANTKEESESLEQEE